MKEHLSAPRVPSWPRKWRRVVHFVTQYVIALTSLIFSVFQIDVVFCSFKKGILTMKQLNWVKFFYF